MKILVIGPSIEKSKGGMATVIQEIKMDQELNKKYDIETYASYADGSKFYVLIYSIVAFLKFYIFKRNYDVYHIHVASKGSTFRKGYYAKVARKWGKRVILHIHGGKYMEFYESASKKKKIAIKKILKNADLVIALSEEWKRNFDNTFNLCNCVVLENGVNDKTLSSAITEPAQNKNKFLALGRLGKNKGTYDLIFAMEKIVNHNPNVCLYLAGDGEVEQVRRLVEEKKLSDNIKILGWINFEKKIEILKQVSTVVLPSYNEGLPMSILEGMAAGKAIISTKVGAIPEVVKIDNGVLIKPGDIESLVAAMIKCSNDIDMLNSMSKNNIKKIKEEFSMQVMHDKLSSWYSCGEKC